MEVTDVCSLDEFKDSDECKNRNGGIMEDIFWAIVLIAIAFFTTTWMNLFNRFLNHIYGDITSNTELIVSAGISLFILLILTQVFNVNIKSN